MIGLQIGRNAATGQYGNMKVPGFIIVQARKTLFIDRMKPLVSGSAF
jgi:hypothetical protein